MQKYTQIADIVAGDTRNVSGIEALLDDGGQSKAMRRTLFAIVFLVAAILVWATLTEVDELAKARGEVQPSGRMQTLQSEEGGRIVSLHVREGDEVLAGQVIADFAATDIDKLVAQTGVRMSALDIDRERLNAILEDREPDFSQFEERYPDLADEAFATYMLQIEGRDAGIRAKMDLLSQQTANLTGARNERSLIEREVKDAQDRLSRLEDGASRGVVPVLRVIDARQQFNAVRERLNDTVSRIASTQSAIRNIQDELAQETAQFKEKISRELSETTEKVSELRAEMEALTTREGEIQLRSPVDGVVMGLPQTSRGAVIPPGGTVAQIVPVQEGVVMEVMVQPRDIGFVTEGQRASVRIDSFDSARFGTVEARVRRVPPTSIKRESDGAPFYKVEVALLTPYVGSEKRRVIPGMTGEADIATGRKPVIQYLLKPLFLTADTAFHER